WVLRRSVALATPAVYFSPGGVQGHLIAAIDNTSHSIDAAVYELSAPLVIKALKRAGERGVQVRLVMDEKVLHEYSKDKELAGVSHVSLRTLSGRDRHRRGMMHNKFAVFDE